MTRREFMEAGAGVALAGALAACQTASTPARTLSPRKGPVRLGMVGVGNRGTFLTQLALALPEVQVRAVCDIVPAHAERAAKLVADAGQAKPECYVAGDTDWRRLVERDDLDAVVCATPWEWHTPVSVAAMRAGKYAATEVPAALTLEECRELVRASEETGMPCMMLENVCYFENVLAVLRMVREGHFGSMLHFEAGYQHDCRFLLADEKGELTWRGKHVATLNGNLYPTHPIGPIGWWLDINRGNRFTSISSVSSPAAGVREYFAAKNGREHPLATRPWALGDVNTSLIETESGATVSLYHNLTSHRPYELIFRVQGTKGIYLDTLGKCCIEGITEGDQWQPFEPCLARFAHPLWSRLVEEAKKHGGHGGCDYITMHQFIEAVRHGTQTPQDVYDAATWSALVPLTIESVAKGGKRIPFPDFTGGRWKTNAPIQLA